MSNELKVYRILHSDGLYQTAGQPTSFRDGSHQNRTKHGKIWMSTGALNNHLSFFSGDYAPGWEFDDIMIEENVLTRVSLYSLDRWKSVQMNIIRAQKEVQKHREEIARLNKLIDTLDEKTV